MKHVLVIEDEAIIAYDLASIVEVAGLGQGHIALTEAEAVAIADHLRPDLILSDHTLIEGTGPQAVARIRDAHGEVPVIYITATPDLCEVYPHNFILSKPINEGALLDRIRLILAPQDQRVGLSVASGS